jgi:predicted GTPase
MTELEGARMYDEKRVSRAGLPLASLLAQAAQALSEFQFASFSRERLRALAQRLADQRLQVAVLGQFKRGKSSFLNALLGTELLPPRWCR